MKPISLQLYSVRERAAGDFVAALREVAEIGYAGVEFAGLHGHEPGEIRKVLNDLGVRASSTHVKLPTKETIGEVVETAEALGYDIIVSMRGGEDFATEEGVRRAAEQFQAAADLLKPHGLRIAYHNHWWEMGRLDKKLAIDLLFERAPDLLAEIDTYWASNFGAVDVAAFVARWAARTPLLHVKDGPLVEGEPHTAVGAGRMDVPAVVAAADERVLEWVVVELDSCATDMMTAVRDSYDYLTREGLARGNR
jgi:sugar phosphate isomerase/epimerase